MAEPTGADRERALELIAAWDAADAHIDDLIAAALADERERVRAPFLALTEEYDAIWRESTATDPVDVLIAGTFRASANDIRRRAAEETGQ